MRYINKGIRLAISLICLLFSGLACALEAEATDEKTLESITMPEIVVTATRDERLTKDTPYSTNVITTEALRIETPARTVPEALKNLPCTMVQKTGHGQGSPYIRGFTGYRNLFLIDGIRLNNSVFRDGPNQYWNTIDPFSLSRLELARGPLSVLYGSDAVGGTVNAITLGEQDIKEGTNWDRRVYYRYGSAENSHVARAESIGRLTNNLALTFGYSLKDFGDIEGGKDVGTQEKTGYDERDWDIKVEYTVRDDALFVLSHQSVHIDDAWRTHKTIYGINWEGLTVGDELHHILDQDRDLTYLQYHQYGIGGFADELHVGVSRHLQSEEQDRLRTQDLHDLQGFDVTTLGAFLTIKSVSSLGTLIYGVEFYHDEVDTFGLTLNPDGSVLSTSIQGPVGDDSTYDMLGVFIQDEILLAGRLSFFLGGRYEFSRADADKVEDPLTGDVMSVSGDWDELVGSVRVLYYLNDDRTWNIFAGMSQGFRAPNLSDLTRFDSARTNEIEIPTPELDPEYFMSYEIGLKAATPRLTAQVAAFYKDVDGMIVRTPTGRIIDGDYEVTKKNAGDGYAMGVELDARYHFWRDLTVFGTLTLMDGEIETYATSDTVLTKEPIDRLMPPTGRFGLFWDPEGNYCIEATCTVAAKADKLSTRDKADTSRIPPGGTPGYTVYDIRAGWNCTRYLTLSLSIENITDKDYRIHGSGVNEAGRNIVFATAWTF